jgi:FtsZ-binding cell division protein ZapB
MVVAMTGLEKFSHLEDRIYRAIDHFKTLKQEKDQLDKEVSSLKRDLGVAYAEKDRLEVQVERLLIERDAVKLKVEAMLDALSLIEQETAQPVRR